MVKVQHLVDGGNRVSADVIQDVWVTCALDIGQQSWGFLKLHLTVKGLQWKTSRIIYSRQRGWWN